MEKDIAKMTKVYIIESPSFVDILENRNESSALSEILKLSGIKNQVYKVSDKETLIKSLSFIAEDLKPLKKDLAAINLHFSLHGSVDGIALSDKSFINWEEFAEIINNFNNLIGFVDLGYKKYSVLHLNFSVCNGLHASKMDNFYKEQLYISLVGPTRNIAWSDSLIAFAVFYHNLLIKKLGIIKTIENVNLILNDNNVFKAIPGKGIVFGEK